MYDDISRSTLELALCFREKTNESPQRGDNNLGGSQLDISKFCPGQVKSSGNEFATSLSREPSPHMTEISTTDLVNKNLGVIK